MKTFDIIPSIKTYHLINLISFNKAINKKTKRCRLHIKYKNFKIKKLLTIWEVHFSFAIADLKLQKLQQTLRTCGCGTLLSKYGICS